MAQYGPLIWDLLYWFSFTENEEPHFIEDIWRAIILISPFKVLYLPHASALCPVEVPGWILVYLKCFCVIYTAGSMYIFWAPEWMVCKIPILGSGSLTLQLQECLIVHCNCSALLGFSQFTQTESFCAFTIQDQLHVQAVPAFQCSFIKSWSFPL